MNGKQQVAITVGAALVLLLVLFPPWYDTHLLGPVRLRWLASDPVVIEEITERVAYFDDYTSKYTRRDEEIEPELRYGTRTKHVHHQWAISYGLAAGGMLASVALTVIAVRVLKDRKTET